MYMANALSHKAGLNRDVLMHTGQVRAILCCITSLKNTKAYVYVTLYCIVKQKHGGCSKSVFT
jgi:hypothetical protein